MLRALCLLAALLVATHAAPEGETPPFDKEELEKLLRKEHSQRVSNIYDSEKGIQCAPPRPPMTFFRPRFFFGHLTERGRPLAGTLGTSRIRSCARALMASAQRMSCRSLFSPGGRWCPVSCIARSAF